MRLFGNKYTFFGLMIAWVLTIAGFWGGIGYAAVHFVKKWR